MTPEELIPILKQLPQDQNIHFFDPDDNELAIKAICRDYKMGISLIELE